VTDNENSRPPFDGDPGSSGGSFPRKVEVAAGIILRGPYVLISRRYEDAHLGGLWEFPGGTREIAESLEECLQREIREELNLTVRVGRPCLSVEQTYPERHITLHFFFCVPVSGTPEALGCQEFCWVHVHDLDQFEFPPADKPVIELLKQVSGL
jgi:8-oxo-dGTP diphosphatase